MTDQDIVDCLARHGIGWGDEKGVTPYPLDGEDAPIYIAAVRELLAAEPPATPRAIAELVIKDGEGKINVAAFDIAPGTYPLYLGSPVAV